MSAKCAKKIYALRVDGAERFESHRNKSVAPAIDDVACRYESAKVSVTVTSHVIHLPVCHGICVSPSGRFPSDLRRPTGFLTAGMLSRPIELGMYEVV
jgi:hypothetical protein